jgi:molecular chaperone DnaJ
VVLHVEPDPFFDRQGNDILCHIPISFSQAALGAHIEVPTLNGQEKITIPPGTQTGQTFTIKGAGISILQRKGRGDEYVQVVVKTPTRLNQRQVKLFEELASMEKEK